MPQERASLAPPLRSCLLDLHSLHRGPAQDRAGLEHAAHTKPVYKHTSELLRVLEVSLNRRNVFSFKAAPHTICPRLSLGVRAYPTSYSSAPFDCATSLSHRLFHSKKPDNCVKCLAIPEYGDAVEVGQQVKRDVSPLQRACCVGAGPARENKWRPQLFVRSSKLLRLHPQAVPEAEGEDGLHTHHCVQAPVGSRCAILQQHGGRGPGPEGQEALCC